MDEYWTGSVCSHGETEQIWARFQIRQVPCERSRRVWWGRLNLERGPGVGLSQVSKHTFLNSTVYVDLEYWISGFNPSTDFCLTVKAKSPGNEG